MKRNTNKIVARHTAVQPVVISLWLMQLIFWAAHAVITFFSLTLWYGSAELPYILHAVLQSIVGICITFPMHWVYRRLWKRSMPTLVLGSILVVMLVSFLATIIRMQSFIWMTIAGEEQWADFGGWYFSGFFIFLCWTALYYNILYYRLASGERDRRILQVEHARAEKVKRYYAEKLASESRMEMLRYQLNPHFLFNTLNAVSALVAVKEATKAREMIDKLSSFLRYSLKDERKEAVKLQEEIEALDLYLSIEKTRFSDRLSIHYNIDEAVLDARVPSLILQPLAENAIKYAISLSERGGVITVAAARKGDNLVVSVTDDGLGIGALGAGVYTKNAFNFGGVGIQNIHDRLENIYGQDGYEMNLYNKLGEGLKVELIFRFERVA